MLKAARLGGRHGERWGRTDTPGKLGAPRPCELPPKENQLGRRFSKWGPWSTRITWEGPTNANSQVPL